MDEKINLDAVLRRGARPYGLDAETARARSTEIGRRNASARKQVCAALKILHPEEYDELYAQARAKEDEENGPLPGDEVAG